MKYVDTMIVFREVPEEISLAINISGCPVQCPGCHSSYLAQDIGTPLDETAVDKLIAANPGISCVSFMGGDADPAYIKKLSQHVHIAHHGLKTCWYSGRDLEQAEKYSMTRELDYIKVGPYIDEFGPLDSPTTNQRFYRISRENGTPVLTDCTSLFLKRFI